MAKRSKKKRTKLKKKTKSKFRKKYQKIKNTKKKENIELIYKTKNEWIKKALVGKTEYEKKYSKSLKDNEGFWKKEGKRINWIKPYSKIKDVKYSKSDVHIKWFYDGTLNASENCIDRHLKKNKDKTAIIGLAMIQKFKKKLPINNYIMKFQKQQMA